MRVLCEWCLKESKLEAEALIDERDPFEDHGDNHGMCPHHRQELEKRVTWLEAGRPGRRNARGAPPSPSRSLVYVE